jgi:hypothetical protein
MEPSSLYFGTDSNSKQRIDTRTALYGSLFLRIAAPFEANGIIDCLSKHASCGPECRYEAVYCFKTRVRFLSSQALIGTFKVILYVHGAGFIPAIIDQIEVQVKLHGLVLTRRD